MNKTKEVKSRIGLTGIVAIIGMVTSLLSLAMVTYVIVTMNDSSDTTMRQHMRLESKSAQALFCISKQIVPCDEIEITKWNEQYPDERFNFVRL